MSKLPESDNDEVQKALQIARIAASKAAEHAANCDRLGLGVLAREWDYFSSSLRDRANSQEHLLRNPGQGNWSENPRPGIIKGEG